MLTVKIDYCFYGWEDPQNNSDWKVYSFSTRHNNFIHPSKLDVKSKLESGLAFWLDCYQHGNTVWSLSGEGIQCRFDTARRGGIAIYEGDEDSIGKEDRKSDCRKMLDEYNDYLNGQVFYYMVTRKDEVIDQCSGIIGFEHAKNLAIESAKSTGEPYKLLEN
jgi:hypothetical protein